MGLGTKVDGNAVRVEVPKLTKETRAAMAKTTGKHSEKVPRRHAALWCHWLAHRPNTTARGSHRPSSTPVACATTT